MTGAVLLEDQLSVGTYVSPESREFGQPMWNLLQAGLNEGLSTSITEAANIALEENAALYFKDLAKIIDEECAFLSTMHEIAAHPAYREIVRMGYHALPLILRDLEKRPSHWFWALNEITLENPVLPEHRGNITAMAQDWLEWGKRSGMKW